MVDPLKNLMFGLIIALPVTGFVHAPLQADPTPTTICQ
jgi:hypothetical protein